MKWERCVPAPNNWLCPYVFIVIGGGGGGGGGTPGTDIVHVPHIMGEAAAPGAFPMPICINN